MEPNRPENYIDLTKNVDFEEALNYTASVMCDDGVVLIPTDTVYGLICMPRSERAINDIYRMKMRPASFHLPIIVADQEQAANDLPLVWNSAADALAKAFWPGSLTLACGIRENDLEWLAGRDEVGVRAPNYPFIQALARKLGPLLMTSANKHGSGTPHTVEGALESLAVRPRLVIDGGVLSGDPSTLVNVNLPVPAVERAGRIPITEIEKVLSNVR